MEKLRVTVLGHSGSGKTGAVASLATAGFRIWLFDFENGSPILSNVLKKNSPALKICDGDSKDIGDINIIQITNGFRPFNGKLIPESGGWAKFNETLASWKGNEAPNKFWLYNLTAKDVVVLDTATGFSTLCVDNYLATLGITNSGAVVPWERTRGLSAQMDFAMRSLTNDRMPAHLIMNAHIQNIREGSETIDDPRDRSKKLQVGGKDVGFPKTINSNFSKFVGTYFNSTLCLEEDETIKGRVRVFSTAPVGLVKTKTSNPYSVKKNYPIETGLADYFRDVLGQEDFLKCTQSNS